MAVTGLCLPWLQGSRTPQLFYLFDGFASGLWIAEKGLGGGSETENSEDDESLP
jgi:hypothetical protein